MQIRLVQNIIGNSELSLVRLKLEQMLKLVVEHLNVEIVQSAQLVGAIWLVDAVDDRAVLLGLVQRD